MKAQIQIASLLEPLRGFWENLTERERRLVGLLGIVFGVLVVGLPIYLIWSSIDTLEDETEAYDSALRQITYAGELLSKRAAERQAIERRYATVAPVLSSFVENKGKEVGYSVREVVDQPNEEVSGFRKRHVRVTMPAISMRTAVEFMAAIDNSPYPVAIEGVEIEHPSRGDQYNIRLDVVAFDRLSTPPSKAAGGTK